MKAGSGVGLYARRFFFVKFSNKTIFNENIPYYFFIHKHLNSKIEQKIQTKIQTLLWIIVTRQKLQEKMRQIESLEISV